MTRVETDTELDISSVPKADIDVYVSYVFKMIKDFYEIPENQAAFEKWQKDNANERSE